MVERIVSWFKRWEPERPFEAFQIEVTSRCNLHCVMCPVTVLADQWPAVDLPWETFQRIARAFEKTKWVYLQGWGEPLLHPRLFDMIALAKSAGCRVGFTNNGTRLTHKAGERLLDLGLDLLAVSIAGATAGSHEAIRVGSNFRRLIENLQRFLALRARRKSDTPKVELLFLMTKTNLAELPRAVELASALGADELVATNLDYVITPQLDELKAFASSSLAPEYREAVEEAQALARRAGLAFRPYPLEPKELAVCELNPLKILFISADGWVSPCVYTGVTGQREIPRLFEGKPLWVSPVRFGNVKEQELMEIWGSPAYRAFRRQFAERLHGVTRLALSAMAGRGAISDEEAAAPEPCRTCPKLYGL
jgi:MoaA/NifB/PqqE/SkfB family radical SAM enzyme